MNYIYDILLDFNNDFYEFYDWNKEDNYVHVRKIPIFKVSNAVLKNIILNDVSVEKDFLDKIFNKTEYYIKDYTELIKYSCLICNDKKVIAIKCNDDGKIAMKSDLLIDEQNEIVSLLDRYNDYDLKYKILKLNKSNELKTRKMCKMENFIIKEIDKQSTNKLKYLLFEFNNEICDTRENILDKIKNNINPDNIEEIYNFLKMIINKKKV